MPMDERRTEQPRAPKVKTGLDVLEAEGFRRLHGRRLGVATNHSAVNAKAQRLLDLLAKHPELWVNALFGPEHGIHGEAAAGHEVADSGQGSIPIYSLYGQRRKPTAEMGKDFDVMLYDIQDVGARFYTYIWTLFYVEQFCAEAGKKLIVLDRPNPIGGQILEGPVLDEKFASFVGLKPIPIRHGLTVGELAILFNQQSWLGEGLRADLEVVPMEGWKREMWHDETGLPWISPSPNILSLDTATVYPGTCLLEGTEWSEGRGTARPFEQVGGPAVDSRRLAEELNALDLQGCRFSPIHFTPERIPGVAPRPKHEGKRCGGVRIQVDDRRAFQPVRTGLAIIMALRSQEPGHGRWRPGGFDRLVGTDVVRKQIEAGVELEAIVASWEDRLRRFDQTRKEAMLYAKASYSRRF